MVNKIFFGIVGVLVYVFAMNWVFNHINAWVSIAMGVGLAYYILTNFINKINQ